MPALLYAIADPATPPDLAGVPEALIAPVTGMLAQAPAARPALSEVTIALTKVLADPGGGLQRLAEATYRERTTDPPPADRAHSATAEAAAGPERAERAGPAGSGQPPPRLRQGRPVLAPTQVTRRPGNPLLMTASEQTPFPARFPPGARILVRGETEWMVRSCAPAGADGFKIRAIGVSELVRETEAVFFTELEDPKPLLLKPEDTILIPDETPKFAKSRLFLEATLRGTPLPQSERGLASRDDSSCSTRSPTSSAPPSSR